MRILDSTAYTALNGTGSSGHVLRPRLISAGVYFLPDAVINHPGFSSQQATIAALPQRSLSYAEQVSLQVNPRHGVLFDDTLHDGELVTTHWESLQRPQVAGVTQADRIQRIEAVDVPGAGDPRRPLVPVYRHELRPYNAGAGDVFPGEEPAPATNRCEKYARRVHANPGSTAAALWPDPPGATRYYGMKIYIHQMTFEVDTGLFRSLCQFKGHFGGSPPLALEIANDEWELGSAVSGGRVSLGTSIRPVEKEVWINFVIMLVLGTTTGTGRISLWRNGVESFLNQASGTDGTLINHATMDVNGADPDPLFFKNGIYRSTNHTTTDIVYFGPTRIADNLADMADYMV